MIDRALVNSAIVMLVGFFGALALVAVKVAPDVWAWLTAQTPLDAAIAVFGAIGVVGFIFAFSAATGRAQMSLMRPPPMPPYPGEETRI